MEQVVLIFHVSPGSRAGILPAGIPAFFIHAVHAVHLDPAALDVFPQRAHHAAILPFVVATHRGWEDQHARPAVAKDKQFHIAVERGAMPDMVFAVHNC